MADKTKMIIMTADRDIIHRISANNTTNTHIVDLENIKQLTSITKDNDKIINLPFLTGLSKLNSNNDQVYKRALDSPHNNRSKPAKISKKFDDSICTICGNYAIGFNYNALSCASCKAFFRRNAVRQHPEEIKCLTGHGQCSIVHGMRRKCPRCRLVRCFEMGMRKSFIRGEEEKQQRKKQLEENRNISLEHLSTSQSTSFSSTSQSIPNLEPFSQKLDEIDRLLMDLDKEDIVFDKSTGSNEMESILLETLSVGDWITIESA